MPSILILLPLLGVMALNLPVWTSAMRRIAFWFACALFLLEIGVAVFHHPLLFGYDVFRYDPLIKMTFLVDPLSFVMLISIGLVSLASLAASRYTIPDSKRRFNFINLLMLAALGMSGTVMMNDLFSLYVFIEITAVSSFVLIALDKTPEGLEGAFKYIILSAVASTLMLSSIAILLLMGGGTSFGGLRQMAGTTAPNSLVMVAMALFICGLFIKGGVVPFHGWLPDAYTAAPAPVSILLAGIATKVTGIYSIIRIVTEIFGFSAALRSIFLAVGSMSILLGAFAALGQRDIKRMLAYSSISQVGYIIAGLGVGTWIGLLGAVFHLFNHAIFKSLLFLNAAAVEHRYKTRDVALIEGLSGTMPVTGLTAAIGMLSTAGIPPLAGFWSKLLVILALWRSGYTGHALIALFAGIVTLGYLLVLQRDLFFAKPSRDKAQLKGERAGLNFVSIVLAGITVAFGIFFPVLFRAFIYPIKELVR